MRLCAMASIMVLSGTSMRSAQPMPANLQVPPGYEIIQVAAPPLISGPMLGGFDERGRLFVSENAGLNLDEVALAQQKPNRIRMLEDVDGDGIFDRSTIFADGLTFPQGAQWYDGALYVASPPSLWRLEDTDNDGRVDVRRELVTGFKFTGNAADVHGPFLHPNGRIYWCHGRKGHEVYQRDGTLVSKGLAARIWSCRPDGSDVQVHAGGGMDNPVELAINQDGDLFGTVNLLHGSPRSDAVLHWIHGGVYPRSDREPVLAEFKRTGDLLPASALLGHVAPAGIALPRNAAWKAGGEDTLYIAEFNTHRIMRLPLQRQGASFVAKPDVFVAGQDSDLHFTDVLEDADGSLLVIDTGAWFRRGCPTSGVAKPDILGAIYRIRRKGMVFPRDPRGLELAWEKSTPAQLVELLDDSRPAVRERAGLTLSKRGEASVAALRMALRSNSYLTRSNAVWALTRISSPDAVTAVRAALADSDFRIRQSACQSVAITADSGAHQHLLTRLTDDAPAVRREAARALGRLRQPGTAGALANAITKAGNDAVLTHALIYALIEINRPAEVRDLLAHAHPLARRAALITLDQISPEILAADAVFKAVRSSEPSLREAAADIAVKHLEWSRAAADFLEHAFSKKSDAQRTAIGARLLTAFISSADVRAWLRTTLHATKGSVAIEPRVFLQAIGKDAKTWDDAWREPLVDALRSSDVSLGRAALQAISVHRERDFSGELRAVAQDSNRPTAFRVAALQLAAGGDKQMDTASFQLLVRPFVSGGAPEARLQAAAVLSAAKLSRDQSLKLAEILPLAGPVEFGQLIGAFQRSPSDRELGAVLLSSVKGSPARWGVHGQDLQNIFRRFPSPVPEDAAPMISEIMNQTAAKDVRVTELEKSIAGGDAARGRAAFLGGVGACVSCHRVGETGGKIGPDLSHIGRIRATRDLIEAIAFPGATIARGYETFLITKSDGGSVTGTIPTETADSLIVALADGQQTTIPRASVAKMEPIASSLMPAGLDRALEPAVFADVVAFLQSLR